MTKKEQKIKEAYKLVIKDLRKNAHGSTRPSAFCTGCIAKYTADTLQEFHDVFWAFEKVTKH